ncbi:MAG: hypothetical protein K2H29_01535 [Oscillospiraceae bacterium]|nr:hypothetical protein [Oscillospiraceae bacterium]
MKLTKKQEKQILEKVREIKILEIQKKEIESEIDGLKGEIKDFMTKKNVPELAVDVFTIHYADTACVNFDTTAFKKTHEELYQQYLKTKIAKRFTIT